MAITAERLSVEVTADTSSASRELSGFSSTGSKAFGMLKTAAIGFGIAGVAAVGTKMVSAASDLNEEVSKTGVIFGKAQAPVIGMAEHLASSYGLVKSEVLSAAGGIGLVAKASGMAKGEAALLSANMAQLGADASSFYNVPMADALAAMKSGLVGESEPMRQFGVLLSEAAVQEEAVRLGIAKRGQALTEGMKVQARASLIQKGMTDASGDLARTSDSVANRLRELQGRATNFAATVGTALLPAVSWALGAFMDLAAAAGKLGTEGFDWLKAKVAEWAVTFGPQLARAKDMAISAWTAIQEGARWVADTVGQFVSQVGTFLASPAIASALANLQDAFSTVWDAIQKFAAAVGGWKNVFIGIGLALAAIFAPIPLLIAAFVALYAKVEWFRTAVNAVITFIIGTVIPSILKFAAVLWTSIAWAVAKVIAIWKVLAPIVIGGIRAIVKAVAGFVSFMMPIWKATWTLVVAVVKAVWAVLKPLIQVGMKIIGTAIKAGMAVIKGAWAVWKAVIWPVVKFVFGLIKGVVTTVMGAIRGVIVGAIKVITGIFQTIEKIVGIVRGAFSAVYNAVAEKVGQVIAKVVSIKDKIVGFFTGAADWLLDAGKAILQGLIDGVQAMIGALQDKFSFITDLIPDWKGPREKDRKLLVEAGKAIMEGLIDGLTANVHDLKKTLGKITKFIHDSFEGSQEDRLIKRVRNTNDRLRNLYEARLNVQKRFADAQDRLARLRDARSSLVDAVTGGISSQANVLNAGNNAGTIAASLATQVQKARKFAADLQNLRKLGFSKAIIAQVASAGIEGGSEVATALAASTKGQVRSINDSFGAINNIAQRTGQQLGDQFYKAGIKSAEGMIKGLRDRRDAIKNTILDIAKGMQDAIKRALGIKSPSSVMRKLFAEVPAGAALGIQSGERGVRSAADRMGRAAIPGMGRTTIGGVRGGTRAGEGTTFVFHTYNPIEEAQSVTTNKALQRAAVLGLVGR